MSDEKEAKKTAAANDDDAAPEAAEAEEATAEATADVEAEADIEAGAEAEAADEAEEAPEPTPEAEIAGLKDQLLRAMAETENTRRRARRELDDAHKYAVAEFARDLLSLADNLERALVSAKAGEEAAGDLSALIEGVELTERQFQQILEKHGVSRIEAEGQKLDPNLHQAMMQIDDEAAVPGTVVQVVQVGYTIHDRLLRPAMVGVAKAPETAAKPDTGQHLDTEA
jgi:molecular chaperone GrpE